MLTYGGVTHASHESLITLLASSASAQESERDNAGLAD